MTNEEILAQPNHLERRALMALNILRGLRGWSRCLTRTIHAWRERIRRAKQQVSEWQ
jgi:hypothetical protein